MSSNAKKSLTPDEALAQLMAGNKRYVAAQAEHPRQNADRRAELSGGQNPFAIILGCSDSRVAPEVLFDQGLGDLFIIRVAGNIVDDVVLGSIEYSAEHLHTPLMVVLGHSKCGAVTATAAGGELEGHLPSLAEAIQPAVERAKAQDGDLVVNAIRENALMVADQLRSSQPIMAELVKTGKLKVVAARYDLDSGQVDLLE
jgi:carbonic anhydrase